MSKGKKIKAKKQEKPAGAELIAVEHSWSGPLPPPSIIEDYEKICPGAAKKIVDAFEKQNAHRIECESIVIKGGVRNETIGLIGGLAVTIAGFVLCAFLVEKGQTAEAIILFIIEIGALVGVFIYSKNSDRNERIQKAGQVRRRN